MFMYVNDVDYVKDVDANAQTLRLQHLELIWRKRDSAREEEEEAMIQLSNVAQRIYWSLLGLFVRKTSGETSLLFI